MNPSQAIGYEFRVVHQMIHHKMEQFRAENQCELTFVQSRVMGFLTHNQSRDVYQKDIEVEMRIRRSTATEILNVLERNGYLVRIPSAEDRRLKKLVMTDKARELDQKMNENIDRMEKLLARNLTDEQLAVFFTVVDQIKKNLE